MGYTKLSIKNNILSSIYIWFDFEPNWGANFNSAPKSMGVTNFQDCIFFMKGDNVKIIEWYDRHIFNQVIRSEMTISPILYAYISPNLEL